MEVVAARQLREEGTMPRPKPAEPWMYVGVPLDPATNAACAAEAKRRGQPKAQFLRGLVDAAMATPVPLPPPPVTLPPTPVPDA